MEVNKTDNINELMDKSVHKPELNDLEKILSTYKLKPVPKSSVGFSKIASHLHGAFTISKFKLNLMLVGCTGLGKSTFLNNLFQTQFPESRQSETISESPSFLLVENGVKIELKIIEVPDFGRKINNSQCWKDINNYIEQCFERQFQIEQKINRSLDYASNDNLVHVCLYFIQPASEDRCLREIDLEFLKCVHDKVNIIPLIAKADSMTREEIRIHKNNLLQDLHRYGINYFRFKVPRDSGWRPTTSEAKYPDKKYILKLIERFPFAVAAGNQTILLDGNPVTVRSYPWGFMQIDDLNHCDTQAVRTLLLSVHLQELIFETRTTIFEHYRSMYLGKASLKLSISQHNESHPLLYLETYFKKVHSALEKKVNEMEMGFQELAEKKLEALEKKRRDVEHESMEMTRELNYLYSKLEQEFSYFIAEKTRWECENSAYLATCGTLKIKKQGLLNVISKFGR